MRLIFSYAHGFRQSIYSSWPFEIVRNTFPPGLNTPFDPGGVDAVWNATEGCHPRLFTFNPFGIICRQDACTTISIPPGLAAGEMPALHIQSLWDGMPFDGGFRFAQPTLHFRYVK